MLKGSLTIKGTPIPLWGYDLRSEMHLAIDVGGLVIPFVTAPAFVEVPEGTPENVVEILTVLCTQLWEIKMSAETSPHTGEGSVRNFEDFSMNTGALASVSRQLHQHMSVDLSSVDFVEVPDLPNRGTGTRRISLKPRPVVRFPDTPSRPLLTVDEVIAAHPSRNFEWLRGRNYQIATKSNFIDIARQILAHDGVVAFDTETTGLDINFQSITQDWNSSNVTGLVFSIEESQGWYFPLNHTGEGIPNICAPDEVPMVMDKVFRPILERKPLVTFNGSFDSKVAMMFGIQCHIHYDVMLAYILSDFWREGGVPDPDRPSVRTSSLKALTRHFLERDSLELGMFIPGYSSMARAKQAEAFRGLFLQLPYESVRLYACADTDNTLALYNKFQELGIVEKYGAKGTLALETNIVNAVAYNEFFGIHYDADSLDTLDAELAAKEESAYAKAFAIAGEHFNPNSSQQKSKIMYERLGYPVKEYTATGNPSTGKNALAALMAERVIDADGNETFKYPFAAALQEYSDAAQIRKSFIKSAHDEATPDGFMFSSIRQSIETGRMATTKPNIQGMSEEVKPYFTPRQDYYMMNFDFSSVESRIMASMAKEDHLIEFFNDPIKDYHRFQGSMLFDLPYARVTPKLRKQAKAFNFGIPYGKGVWSLAKDLFGESNRENEAKAQVLYDKYFSIQPKVKQFFEDSYAFVDQNEYIPTQFGRRRYFNIDKLASTPNGGYNYQKGVKAARRMAGNHRIQGTAADLYKMGLQNFYNILKERGWLGKVLLTAYVHDECNMEVHKTINPVEMVRELTRAFMIKIPGWTPLYMGMGFGYSWYQAKSQDLPVGVQDYMMERGYNWDGDLDKFIAWSEDLRREYMKYRVDQYLLDPSSRGVEMDSDIDDFIHVMYPEFPEGTHPALGKYLEATGLELGITPEDLESVFLDPTKEPEPTPTASNQVPSTPEVNPDDVMGINHLEKIRHMGVMWGPNPNSITVYVPEEHENLIVRAIEANPGDLDLYLVLPGNDSQAPRAVQASVQVSESLFYYLLKFYKKVLDD